MAQAASSSNNSTSSATTSYAQPSVSGTSVCTYSKGFTATANADIQKIDGAGCATFDGDIVIKGDGITEVVFANIQQIQGSLTIDSATQLKSFVSNSLIAVSDSLTLTNLTILEDLELPRLFKVGLLSMTALPAVGVLSFNALDQVNDLLISDCSFTNITGLVFDHAALIDINNNKELEELSLPNLHDVLTALGVTYNSENIQVAFDNLIWANNITFRDVKLVLMDNLTAVNQSLAFFNNSIELIVLEELTSVGGSLSISGNEQLNEVELPNLTSISGAFQITKNDDLESLTGFDSLKTVGGAMTFNGDFTNASFPSLKTVKGGATINSTGDLDCSPFNKLSKQGGIQGHGYKCASAHSLTTAKASKSKSGSSSDDDSSSDSSSSSSSSKGAADSLYTSFGTVLAALALSFF